MKKKIRTAIAYQAVLKSEEQRRNGDEKETVKRRKTFDQY